MIDTKKLIDDFCRENGIEIKLSYNMPNGMKVHMVHMM